MINNPNKLIIILFTCFCISFNNVSAQNTNISVARKWNEQLLEAIRNDFARPTVHARNLLHISAALYDAWAVYDVEAKPYFLGNNSVAYQFDFKGIRLIKPVEESRKEAISYAAYRLLIHRFKDSPGFGKMKPSFDLLMNQLGYDINFTSADYCATNSPAALGNFIAEQVIAFGLQDGSNEENDYQNMFYEPSNPNLLVQFSGTSNLIDPNAWQPLEFRTFIDQSGNVIPGGIPEFLGAEWGSVTPFALAEKDLKILNKDEAEFWVYHDPGRPAHINLAEPTNQESLVYKWNFEKVLKWSSFLDPQQEQLWDISPASIGGLSLADLPNTFEAYQNFYAPDGKDFSSGYELNPITNEVYEPQIVKRADYVRVLAEFWADGPASETPPGHWFTILNYVSDHSLLEKRLMGQGELVTDLEWDVKTYFTLAGALHDAAIAAWSIKGYYDYIRPVSAIRFMGMHGQSSDINLPNYHPAGLRLAPDLIELIEEGDSLEGINGEHIGKLKVKAWKGHRFIEDPEINVAGVGWIRAEDWTPYQLQTFVTPPFAGYISGHSTFSRAAAEVLSLLTGNEYFPGGMGEFEAPGNEFLDFENGPTKTLTLQWAKYTDASDQCSLSRIWGGIHPPIDDIPGRRIGYQIGIDAFNFATTFFEGKVLSTIENKLIQNKLYPNPAIDFVKVSLSHPTMFKAGERLQLLDVLGKTYDAKIIPINSEEFSIDVRHLPQGIYFISVDDPEIFLKFVKK